MTEEIKERLKKYRKDFDEDLARVEDVRSLSDTRNRYLSRSRGYLTLLFNQLKGLKTEARPEIGRELNELKAYILERLQNRKDEMAGSERVSKMADLTLPGKRKYWGSPHPILLFQQEIENIFFGMGFSIEEGPEIETDYYNFEALKVRLFPLLLCAN